MSVGSRGTQPVPRPVGKDTSGGKPSDAKPTPRQPSSDTKPGLQAGESAVEYDTWWSQVQTAVAPWMYANPTSAGDIKALAWQYRDATKDDIIDLMFKRGYASPAATPAPGSGGRGGGGGGGASKVEQYAAAKAELKNRSAALGRPLSDDELDSFARVVVDASWSSAMVDDYLLQDPNVQNQPGLITAHIDQIKQLGADQLLKVSDETAKDYAMRIESGEMTIDAVKTIMGTQASLQHGWAADQIAQGINVRDMLLPARDQIASELELSPNAIDLMDPKYLGMVQTTDGKTGQPRAATMSEVITRARKDQRYAATNNAKRSTAGSAQLIRQIFEGG